MSAEKGKILLKERFAVLCATRLLLFKKPLQQKSMRTQQALAVYPLVNSDFDILDAPTLTQNNISAISQMKTNDLRDIKNLMQFVRISFTEVAQVRDLDFLLYKNESMKIKRDFYFGNQNQEWIS